MRENPRPANAAVIKLFLGPVMTPEYSVRPYPLCASPCEQVRSVKGSKNNFSVKENRLKTVESSQSTFMAKPHKNNKVAFLHMTQYSQEQGAFDILLLKSKEENTLGSCVSSNTSVGESPLSPT